MLALFRLPPPNNKSALTRRPRALAASLTEIACLAGNGPHGACQCAEKPENNQDDENQAEHAAQPRRAVATMGVVAASAAQQHNQEDDQQYRSHERSSSSRTRRSGRDGHAFLDLFRDNGEACESMGAEGCDHRDVGGVASARNQDATDARLIVPRIKGEPSIAQKNFEPSVEVHRSRIRRYADVAKIAVAITRRDVEATA